MRTLSIVLLILAGLMYAGFGAIFIYSPAGAGQVAGFDPIGPLGRTEIRSFYGGMEVGIGAFLLISAWRDTWRRSGLWLVLLLLAPTAAGRGLGFVLEGTANGIHIVYIFIESTLALLSALCLLRGAQASSWKKSEKESR